VVAGAVEGDLVRLSNTNIESVDFATEDLCPIVVKLEIID
jgi:hypothetical protein